MKKIIYIITTSDISYQQPLIRTATSLQQAGYDVKMIGRKLPDSIALNGLPFKHTRIRCIFNKKWTFYLEFNLRVFFCLLFTKQDAICAVDLDTSLPVLFVSRLKRIPRIYDARELFTEMKTVIDRPRIARTWKKIERYCLPKFSFGYAVSKSIADELHKRYGVNYTTIRNVPILRDQRSANTYQSEEPYILYQGYIHEARGIEELIIAMQHVSMKLVICGKGSLFDRCTKLVSDLNLQSKVIFKGLIPPEQLPAYTENAYIGINLVEPSGLNQYFSLANKFFDYIHAQVPQLSMNFPEYKRVNDEYEVGVLIDNIDPKSILAGIQTLIENKSLYTRLKGNCKLARTKLNWQQEEKNLLAFYQKVVQ